MGFPLYLYTHVNIPLMSQIIPARNKSPREGKHLDPSDPDRVESGNGIASS
jgi:hypothetical protein